MMTKQFMITHITDSGSLEINWLSSTIIKSFTLFFGQTGRQHQVFFHLVRPVHRSFGMGCLSYFLTFLIHMIQKEQEETERRKVEKAMKEEREKG